jgi:hypothetical protein
MGVDMGAEWVGSGVRPNKKSHPHGWLDSFVSRFAKLGPTPPVFAFAKRRAAG